MEEKLSTQLELLKRLSDPEETIEEYAEEHAVFSSRQASILGNIILELVERVTYLEGRIRALEDPTS